jgi:hypothetical protein
MGTLMEVKIQSTSGLIIADYKGDVEVEGKKYAVIRRGVGGFVDGIYSSCILVQPHLIERNVESVRHEEDAAAQ